MDRAYATETVVLGSIPGQVEQGLQKLVFIVSLLDFSNKRNSVNFCEASTVCDNRQMGNWAGGSLTRRPKEITVS